MVRYAIVVPSHDWSTRHWRLFQTKTTSSHRSSQGRGASQPRSHVTIFAASWLLGWKRHMSEGIPAYVYTVHLKVTVAHDAVIENFITKAQIPCCKMRATLALCKRSVWKGWWASCAYQCIRKADRKHRTSHRPVSGRNNRRLAGTKATSSRGHEMHHD
jgi:hypothetical protein